MGKYQQFSRALFFKMASDQLTPVQEQRVVMKFLLKEGSKPAEIYRRLSCVFGEQTVARSSVFEWCKRFREGRESIEDEPREGRPKSVITSEAIHSVEKVVLDDRRVTVREVAMATGISKSSVDIIIRDYLNFHKVSCRWVPKQLNFDQKAARVAICRELLGRYEREGESWVHYYTPETKRASMQWKHPGSPPPKKFRTSPSVGKVMASVFWDHKGIVYVHFLKRGETINAEYYSSLLFNKVRKAIHKKRTGMSSKGVILQHDNARPHTAAKTMAVIDQLHWEVLPHPPYSPDLAPSDFHLFGPLKEHLGGQKFDTDDEVCQVVLQWLKDQPKEFYAAGMQKIVARWEKCVAVAGDYVEK